MTCIAIHNVTVGDELVGEPLIVTLSREVLVVTIDQYEMSISRRFGRTEQ